MFGALVAVGSEVVPLALASATSAVLAMVAAWEMLSLRR